MDCCSVYVPLLQTLLQTMAHRLPDGGEKLRAQRMEIMNKISQIKKAPPPDLSTHRNPVSATSAQDKVCLGQARRLYVWSAYLT